MAAAIGSKGHNLVSLALKNGNQGQKLMSIAVIFNNQRTNGPVNAHLISWPTLVKHKTYKT